MVVSATQLPSVNDYFISAISRRVVYSGSAGTGPYYFEFQILDFSDVAVYKNGIILTPVDDYQVFVYSSTEDDADAIIGSGYVELTQSATSSDIITLASARAIERITDFLLSGDLTAASLNRELDALTIFLQQLEESLSRAMLAGVNEPLASRLILPSLDARKGRILYFDDDGLPQAGASASDVAAAAAAIRYLTDEDKDTLLKIEEMLREFEYVVAGADTSLYLGVKASDPTENNRGEALVEGNIYYNTADSRLKVYVGSAWVLAHPDVTTTDSSYAIAASV